MRRSGIGRENGSGDGADSADRTGGDAAHQDREQRQREERERQRRAAARRRPLWRRVLVWTGATLAFLLVTVAVAAYLYIRHLNGNITTEDLHLGSDPLDKAPPNADGQTPLNILLLGSDSRDGEENQDLGGARDLAGGPKRADVQMLLHVAADRSNMTLISIPRDTQVTIPECTDPETGEVYPEEVSADINTSLSHGGPGCTVATWEELTGIPIDHMMMVDFKGVVDMADAVGGVPVCVDANIEDPDSGLRLEEGETVVEGEQALQWLRTRHAFEDGSDIGRTRAQQMYLGNMATELQDSAKLTNPGELMDLAEAATSALTVDPGLNTVNKLYDLGQDLRRVPSERINMMTMPWLRDPENSAKVIPDPVLAEELFSLVRQDIPLDRPDARPSPESSEDESGASGESGASEAPQAPPAAEIAVAVRNGTGSNTSLPVDGRAAVITGELHRLGFTSAYTDTAPAAEAGTVVLYPEGADRAAAEAVADALGLPADAVQPSPASAQLTLIIGEDWREGTAYPAQDEAADPDAGESGGTGSGADGGSGDGGGSPFEEDDFLSGNDDACMEANPSYTW